MPNMPTESFIAIITNNRSKDANHLQKGFRTISSQNLHILRQIDDTYCTVFTNGNGQINMQSAVLFNEKQTFQYPNSHRGLGKSATDISIDMDFK